MTDKPTKKDVDEILELDSNRTQGNKIEINAEVMTIDGVEVAIGRVPVYGGTEIRWGNTKYSEEENDAFFEFICLAPKMAQIIRHQQELLEECAEVLEGLDIDTMGQDINEFLEKLQPMLTNEGEE